MNDSPARYTSRSGRSAPPWSSTISFAALGDRRASGRGGPAPSNSGGSSAVAGLAPRGESGVSVADEPDALARPIPIFDAEGTQRHWMSPARSIEILPDLLLRAAGEHRRWRRKEQIDVRDPGKEIVLRGSEGDPKRPRIDGLHAQRIDRALDRCRGRTLVQKPQYPLRPEQVEHVAAFAPLDRAPPAEDEILGRQRGGAVRPSDFRTKVKSVDLASARAALAIPARGETGPDFVCRTDRRQAAHRRQGDRVVCPAVGVRPAPIERGRHRGHHDFDPRIRLKAAPIARGQSDDASKRRKRKIRRAPAQEIPSGNRLEFIFPSESTKSRAARSRRNEPESPACRA